MWLLIANLVTLSQNAKKEWKNKVLSGRDTQGDKTKEAEEKLPVSKRNF